MRQERTILQDCAKTQAYKLHVPDARLDDLHVRLERARFPDPAGDAGWECGTETQFMRELVQHWMERFDWRQAEDRLNSFAQFKTRIDGADIHYLHVLGAGPSPKPLLLLHGWPGSVFEFLKIIPRLVDPARFGGSNEDAFTIIAPSLPGYCLSFNDGQRFSNERITDILVALMSDVLGYSRFGVQAGDWGASIASSIGYRHPEKVSGIHLNFLPLQRDPAAMPPTDPMEVSYITQLRHWLAEEAAYGAIQSTRPQTLAFGLNDSPVGLAAWFVEKFRAWSDCAGDVRNVWSFDEILENISLYWFTDSIASSFWPYYARAHGPWPVPHGSTVDVPLGYCEFPMEVLRPPRSLACKVYTDIRRWQIMGRGGHFAAWEEPKALAEEVQAFFGELRG